jgi:hypothetical protein
LIKDFVPRRLGRGYEESQGFEKIGIGALGGIDPSLRGGRMVERCRLRDQAKIAHGEGG